MSQGYTEDYKTKKSPVKKVGTIFYTLYYYIYIRWYYFYTKY